jgi:hypothetical protein
MAATIVIKNSVTTGAKPTTSDIIRGELAVNLIDKRIYTRDNSNNIIQVGGIGATGGGVDAVFYENSQTVTTNYTITTGASASSTGPISISSGVSVTIPDGSRWVIL